MDWLFEARRDTRRRFPWISIPGVTSIVYWVMSEPDVPTARKQLDPCFYPFLKEIDIKTLR
jgi:hypothetical protein